MASPEIRVSRTADMGWLWTFVSRHRFSAVAAIVTGAVGGITAALEPYVIGSIIDNLYAGVDMDQVLGEVVLVVVLGLVTLVAFFGQRYYSGLVAYSVHYDMRRAIFENMVTLDQGFYQRYATGDLISRMFSDLNWVWRLLTLGFTRGGSSLATTILAFVLLASINIPLTLLVFVIISISTALQIRAGLILVPISEHVQDQAGNVSSLVQDTVTGIQTIKTFGREEGVNAKFLEENKEFRRRWLFFKRRNEPVGMLPQMISQLMTGVIVIFGGIMTVRGEITLGNFTQFILYLALISNVLLQLGTIYQRYQQTRGALMRVTPLLQQADIRDADDARHLSNPRGDIRFEHVSLRSEGKWLLRDINLHIPAGTVVAIVGATGCGKTTMVNLLSRVMDPTNGRVLVDGADVRHLHLEDLRDAIAYVPQSTFLFSQALHENVRMGRPSIDEDELTRAIHISRVSNDLRQLPHGLDTLVGEKGVMLSGGQKQRVAIARAIIRDPAILVLDDALSSVDTQTAADILGDLRKVLTSRTSIIIAHRIGTVKDADLIIVMDEGKIIETGTHTKLIEQDGLYARMVERELKQDEDQFGEEESA